MISVENFNNTLKAKSMENVMEGVNGQLQIKYQKIATEYSKVRNVQYIIYIIWFLKIYVLRDVFIFNTIICL